MNEVLGHDSALVRLYWAGDKHVKEDKTNVYLTAVGCNSIYTYLAFNRLVFLVIPVTPVFVTLLMGFSHLCIVYIPKFKNYSRGFYRSNVRLYPWIFCLLHFRLHSVICRYQTTLTNIVNEVLKPGKLPL